MTTAEDRITALEALVDQLQNAPALAAQPALHGGSRSTYTGLRSRTGPERETP